MKTFLSTKEAAQFLDVNEKMIYTLVAEKGLPATKITGKWLFPRHLVEQWIETNTINYPESINNLPPYEGLLIITGSNDPLLEKTITLFNRKYPDHIAVFGNLGSMGGVRALRRNLCHMASSHLVQEDDQDYNFEFAARELDRDPAIVNFCFREQGIIVQKKNPKNISGVKDLARNHVKIVNRPLGTGTRLLFDRELKKSGIAGESIDGYYREVGRHMDVGFEILSGQADAGPAIRYIAALLDLDFIPLRWERYDLLIGKERFFDKGVQVFLSLLHEEEFHEMAGALTGYDLKNTGKMVFKDGTIEEKPAP
ncbi:MAG: helix-turn-helix transcriptional regulator [Desulfobacterales bacterium]